MRKILLALVLPLIVFFLGYKVIVAQTPTTTQTGGQTTKPISRCLAPTRESGHTVVLNTDPKEPALESNHVTYITECFSFTSTGAASATNICTTGNSQLDRELFGIDNLTKLQTDVGLSFTAEASGGVYLGSGANKVKMDPPQTVRTDNRAYIPTITWSDYTPVARERRWLAYQMINVAPAIRTKVGGEQQATLDFLADPAVCAPFVWDPDGQVFDAVTLDPIPGATVTLLKRYTSGYQNALQSEKIINPQVTIEDGKFSFFVTDGDYKLSVVAPGYTFPVTDITKVNSNYSKIYLNPDAYPVFPTPADPTAPKTKIYPAQTGEVLTVKGRPQHGDVPIAPSKATGFEHKKVVVTSFIEQRMLSGNINIQGEVSHPFAKITVYVVDKNSTASVPTPLATTYRADRKGKFSFILDQNTLTAGKLFDHVSFEAVDLTGPLSKKGDSFFGKLWSKLGSFFGQVQAQTTSTKTDVKLNQIPAYLEGYAYDASGKVIPNATVGVYLTFSNKPSYETATDEKGFFKLTSEYLPNMPYTIRYTSATGFTTTITPETFITQNAKYLADNKINLYGYRDVKGGTTPPPFFLNTGKKTGAAVPTATQSLVGANQAGNSFLTTLIILLLLVGVLGLILGVYLLKKNQQVPPVA